MQHFNNKSENLAKFQISFSLHHILQNMSKYTYYVYCNNLILTLTSRMNSIQQMLEMSSFLVMLFRLNSQAAHQPPLFLLQVVTLRHHGASLLMWYNATVISCIKSKRTMCNVVFNLYTVLLQSNYCSKILTKWKNCIFNISRYCL